MPDPGIDAAATLFGGQVATASATNYQLTGIVAAGRESVAIIVAEGSPPKALKVGKELVPGITLAEVHARYVMLSDGGVMKRLDLAADTKPAADMGGPGVPAGPAAAVAPPPNVTTGVVQEPPMAPGAVQPATQAQEFPNQGDAAPQEAPPANPNSAPANPNNQHNLNNPNANNQAPAPVQMPPPTRSTGSPVSGQSQTQ
jgi:general secretion pathway protein C